MQCHDEGVASKAYHLILSRVDGTELNFKLIMIMSFVAVVKAIMLISKEEYKGTIGMVFGLYILILREVYISILLITSGIVDIIL